MEGAQHHPRGVLPRWEVFTMNLITGRQTNPLCDKFCRQLAWTPPWISQKQCMNLDWVLGHQGVGSWQDPPFSVEAEVGVVGEKLLLRVQPKSPFLLLPSHHHLFPPLCMGSGLTEESQPGAAISEHDWGSHLRADVLSSCFSCSGKGCHSHPAVLSWPV